jgi:murein L,D-transpeptidase YcbB/YkuD
MKKCAIPMMFCLLICFFLTSQSAFSKNFHEQVRDGLRNRLESSGLPLKVSIGNELIHTTRTLPQFYESRIYEPAWSANGEFGKQVKDLIKAIQIVAQEGLIKEDYHLSKLLEIVQEIEENRKQNRASNPRRWVDLDLLSTDAFLLLASHLFTGCVNPETIDPEWFANRRGVDFSAILVKALHSGNIGETLRGLVPPQAGYVKLRDALFHYREIARRGGGLKYQKALRCKEAIRT